MPRPSLIVRPWFFIVIAAAALLATGCGSCGPEPEDPDPDPAGCETEADCAEGEACVDGACVVPATEGCEGDEDCDEGWHCNLLTGECAEDEEVPEPICDPGTARCSGEGTVETCATDGLAWVSEDCPAATPACYEGACHVCVPGRQWCDGVLARTCAADGTSFQESDCGIGGGRCEEGVCIACEPGQRQCAEDGVSLMVCNATGTAWHYDWCEGACDPVTATCEEPTECTPGSPPVCRGDLVMVCGEEGELEEAQDCAAEGATCQAGACRDLCEEAVASSSYIGCEYWPVVLSNTQLDERFRGEFAVVLSNPNAATTAQVAVYRHGETDPFAATEVPANEIAVVRLPWNALDARGEYDSVSQRLNPQTQRGLTAYRLVSSVPVTAYQFNPLTSHIASGCSNDRDCSPGAGPATDFCDRDLGACIYADYTYTNDASLLLPAHILGEGGSTYVALTMPHMERYIFYSEGDDVRVAMPSFVALVATAPGTTEVTFRSRGATAEGAGLGAFVPGEEYVLELEQFEVVQLASDGFGDPAISEVVRRCTSPPGPTVCYDDMFREFPAGDLTGSIIVSDKPIAVYSGADCRFMPFGEWACDHMEQQLIPFHNWGDRYVGAISATPPGGETVGDYFRIVAAVDGTEVSFTPEVHGGVTLPAGGWIEFQTTQDFVVETQGETHPVMVSQFFVGQNAHGSEMGDPSMVLAVPTAQYRNNFVFTTTETIARNYVNVVRPAGQAVLHNGQVLPGSCWQPVAGTGFEVCRFELPEGVHVHRVVSDADIAVTVYGYDRYVSYGYPAGLDLEQTISFDPGW